MLLYRFRALDYLRLIVLIVLCYAYALIDQTFVPAALRPFALLVVVLALLTLLFWRIKPDNPPLLARTLSLYLGVIVVLIILIQHVIITRDISYKVLIILAITMTSPLIAGVLYQKLGLRKESR